MDIEEGSELAPILEGSVIRIRFVEPMDVSDGTLKPTENGFLSIWGSYLRKDESGHFIVEPRSKDRTESRGAPPLAKSIHVAGEYVERMSRIGRPNEKTKRRFEETTADINKDRETGPVTA
jgi:hypothetical protein